MAALCRIVKINTPSKIVAVFEGVNNTCRKMKRTEIFEIAQVLVYLAAYNYFYTASMAPFKWENYLICFLPILVESLPSYFIYFIIRKILFCRFHNKFKAALASLMAYAFVSFFIFLFVSQVLQNDESVTLALSEASIYSPLFLLPFLVMECLFEKSGNFRLR